jgi:membrane-bound lytic murein transglycosylase D
MSIREAELHQVEVRPTRELVPVPPYDEIMASPLFGDPDFDAAVEAWVEYWSGDAAEAMPTILSRMAAFETSIDSAIAAHDLPPSLRFLPFIESGYNPAAASVASAIGMWQFMAGTARGMGMEVSRLLDERRDPVRSTEGALLFLTDLRAQFGSWFLALAAYNGGPTRLRRVLQRHAPQAEPSDVLFWELRQHLPRETREFVPKLVGAAIVAGRPGAFGIERPERGDRFQYDEVRVPDATSLDVVARAAEASLDEIERLNPQFVRGMTPPGRATGLRVPRGRASVFERNYAAIPPEDRLTIVEHRVEQGETLSHIALLYGVLVADLAAANPGIRPRFLRIGAMLTVPVAPTVRSGAAGR